MSSLDPLAGKEESKRERAEAGGPIDMQLAEHRSPTIPDTVGRDNGEIARAAH